MSVPPVYPMQHQEHTFTKTYVSPEFCLHGTPCVSSVRRLAETRTGLGWVTVTSGPHAGLPEAPTEQGDALALSQWPTPPAGQDRHHPPRSGRGSGALHATPGLEACLPARPTRDRPPGPCMVSARPARTHSLTPSLSCVRASGCGRRRRPPRKHSAAPRGPEGLSTARNVLATLGRGVLRP